MNHRTTLSLCKYGACFAMMTALAGCGREAEPQGFRAKQLAASFTDDFLVPDLAFDTATVLASNGSLEIGDRVKVLDHDGGFASVSNAGQQVTRIGVEAELRAVFAKGEVDLRDRAHVYGDLIAGLLKRGNDVKIDGTIGSELGGLSSVPEPGDAPEGSAVHDISLEPDTERALDPGTYGKVSVKSRAVLRLREGTYQFNSLMVEPGATLLVASDCSAVHVRVAGDVFFRGKVAEEGGDDAGVGLSLFLPNADTAHIEAPYRGIVHAPKGTVILSSQVHEGQFLAHNLRVQAGATVQLAEPFPQDPAECGLSEPATPPTVPELSREPAPALDGVEDLDTFLAWYYGVRQSELDQVEDALLSEVADTAVTDALIERFEAARGERRIGRAVMILGLLGAKTDAVARQFIVDLMNEPLPDLPDDPEGSVGHFSELDYEIAYRSEAMLYVKKRDDGLALLEDIALSYPNADVRRNAIALLRAELGTAEVGALRERLKPEDRPFIDRPHVGEEDFYTQLDALLDR